ncbi:MAG: ribonuclease PH [Promethearchaeota archaeon]
MTYKRQDDRGNAEMRPVEITRNFNIHAEGSALVKQGNTHVIVTASVQESVPKFLYGSGTGWITAEYSMLPRSTHTRMRRERGGNIKGRTSEIQRLIGRSLRAAFDYEDIGERTIQVDCDVIQADGGTRCASITGGFVAVYDALRSLVDRGELPKVPVRDFVAAISLGIKNGTKLVDLDYREDSRVDVDLNVVMTASGKLVEIQGTAEGEVFSRDDLVEMVDLAEKSIQKLVAIQKDALGILDE